MHTPKLLLLALIVSLLLPGCPAPQPNGGNNGNNDRTGDSDSATVDQTVSADAAGITEIVVKTENGNIDIGCVQHVTEVKVVAQKFATGGSPSGASQNANDIQIIASPDPAQKTRLIVQAFFPQGQAPKGHGAHLTITMPASPSITIKGRDNPSIAVRGCHGNIDILSTNADVRLDNIEGNAKVRTTDAGITTEYIKGNQDFKTSNGDIWIKDFTGKVKVKTSYAKIILASDRPATPIDIDLESESGDPVRIELPGTIKVDLDIDAPNGSLRTDLQELKVVNKVSNRHMIRGKLSGGGGGSVKVRNPNGHIVFRIAEFSKKPGQ